MIESIVFLIQNMSRPAGSERVTSILANELVTRGYKVSIVSICGDSTSFYPLDKSIELHTIINKEEINNKKYFFKVLSGLKKYYDFHEVDLVIDIFAALSIYTILLKKKYGFKNLTWEHFNYKVNTGMNKIGRKLAVRFSDQIVTLTETDKKFYEAENKIRGKIDYIYNPSPYQDVFIDKERKPYIMSVGRLTYQKGFDRLIKVWSVVEPQCDWELMIFGEGEDRKSLQNQIDEAGLKRIKLMGAVKNIDEYYTQASLYVSTARFEGLPMTMIEAQSFGVPIISFDYDTGPREMVTDGLNGAIIDRSNEESMIAKCAEKTVELIRNADRRKYYENEAIIAAKRFRTDEIMKKWMLIFERLL